MALTDEEKKIIHDALNREIEATVIENAVNAEVNRFTYGVGQKIQEELMQRILDTHAATLDEAAKRFEEKLKKELAVVEEKALYYLQSAFLQDILNLEAFMENYSHSSAIATVREALRNQSKDDTK